MSLVHLLSGAGQLTAAAVVCGDRTAAVATWEAARVTCPACRGETSRCTCSPTVPQCPACRAYAQTHRADGSRRTAPLLPTLRTEKQLQEAIRQVARERGFLTYHTLTSYGSEPGFPDLVMAKPHHPLFFIEAKMETGRVTPAQQRWMDVLHTITSVEAHVWRPNDLAQALEVLRGANG